jgi:hypothetical protein
LLSGRKNGASRDVSQPPLSPARERSGETPADTPAPARKKQPGRESKKVVTVYPPESVWRDGKMLAARTDTTIDAIMRRGLDMVLMQHGVNRGAVEE